MLDLSPQDTHPLVSGALRYDYQLAQGALARHPGRFRYVARFDPADPELDALVAAAAANPDVVCTRISDRERLRTGGDAALLAAASRHEVPVMVYVSSLHDAFKRYLHDFPGVQFIVDHCGIFVTDFFPAGSSHPATYHIDALLQYAQYPNVAIKLSHSPRLSRMSYPFADVQEQVARLIDGVGVDRVMWASDYTVNRDHQNYAEGLFSIRHSPYLSESDKEQVLGKTLRSVLRWPRPTSVAPEVT